jgi:cyclic pyranopterin phosphate synthase
MSFSHFDTKGRAVMVDVTAKQPTLRTAISEARVHLQPATIKLIQTGKAAKGDVLGVARLAGIAASKKTADLIPLAHPLSLHAVSIEFDIDEQSATIRVTGKVTAVERTGVEMEAMVSVSVAALTIYDMCKGVDRGITISDISLVYKEGGKSGIYRKEERCDA